MEITLEWLKQHKFHRTEHENRIIRKEYQNITGRYPDPNCPDSCNDAFHYLINHYKLKAMAAGYVLKPGISFRYQNKVINRHNLTAAAAEWFIGEDLENRKKFESLGKDWEEYEKEPSRHSRNRRGAIPDITEE